MTDSSSSRRTRMLLGAACILLLLVGWAAWVLRDQSSHSVSSDQSATGSLRNAPSFNLSDDEGKLHRLEDFPGSAVIVHFWASWCPPCVDEIPRWIGATQAYKDLPIKWVAISVDEKWEDAHKILPASAVPKGVFSLLDPKSEMPERFGTFQFPETYLLDSQHRIAVKWVGSQDWTSPEIRKKIEGVIKSQR